MADDLSTFDLFAGCVRVHCVVLEKQPLTPGFGWWGWGLVGSRRVTAVIALRKRPVPFRTRKLSLTAPMVLHSGGCGRVGRRRTSSVGEVENAAEIAPRVGCGSRRSPPLPFFMPVSARGLLCVADSASPIEGVSGAMAVTLPV